MVDPRGTSRRCSGCGREPDRPKTLGDRVHGCDGCGLDPAQRKVQGDYKRHCGCHGEQRCQNTCEPLVRGKARKALPPFGKRLSWSRAALMPNRKNSTPGSARPIALGRNCSCARWSCVSNGSCAGASRRCCSRTTVRRRQGAAEIAGGERRGLGKREGQGRHEAHHRCAVSPQLRHPARRSLGHGAEPVAPAGPGESLPSVVAAPNSTRERPFQLPGLKPNQNLPIGAPA
ncbi:MAG: hypothetical protein F4213_13845 [Boseongicola sp. SB0677_bin_26]|nr:hypothetical protein [Boseongicola sp. SB0665_bin_10]MYG27084.1 hypothetical protein [Boseongicola sp. SB0677_bin_26]